MDNWQKKRITYRHQNQPHCALQLVGHAGNLIKLTTHSYRADSRFALSQWETSLQSNTVCHWLGANLESALQLYQIGTRSRDNFHILPTLIDGDRHVLINHKLFHVFPSDKSYLHSMDTSVSHLKSHTIEIFIFPGGYTQWMPQCQSEIMRCETLFKMCCEFCPSCCLSVWNDHVMTGTHFH